jgi:hypothetical protein
MFEWILAESTDTWMEHEHFHLDLQVCDAKRGEIGEMDDSLSPFNLHLV